VLSPTKRPYSIIVDSNIRHLDLFFSFWEYDFPFAPSCGFFFNIFFCLERFYRSVLSSNSFCMSLFFFPFETNTKDIVIVLENVNERNEDG